MRVKTGDRIKCDGAVTIEEAAQMRADFARQGLITRIVVDDDIWLEVVGERD